MYALSPCLSNICYLVCGFEKSAHHTHIHTLSSSFFHCTHTHTACPNSPAGLCGPVYTQLCPDKEERGQTEGQTFDSFGQGNIQCWTIFIHSSQKLSRISYMTAQNKMISTVWRIDLRFNSLSLHKKIPFESWKRLINKITVGEQIQSVICIQKTVCLFLKEMWQTCNYPLSKNS